MHTKDYILNDIKPLSLNSTIADAKALFNVLIFTHLPIVEDGNLVGLIAETDVQSLEQNQKKLTNYQYLFEGFYTNSNANWFDLLKEFANNQTNVIPILNPSKKYIGYFELADILNFFNNTPFLQENGTILIISNTKDDFSLSQVSQIIERNNAKLFGLFISKAENKTIEITLKLDTQNINEILHALRRYNYIIVSNIKEDQFINDLKDRSEYLQKYLNI